MTNIATKLLEKNPKLTEALEAAESKGQYKAIEPYITGKLCGIIAKAEGIGFISRRDLIWAVIDCFNGTTTDDELVW